MACHVKCAIASSGISVWKQLSASNLFDRIPDSCLGSNRIWYCSYFFIVSDWWDNRRRGWNIAICGKLKSSFSLLGSVSANNYHLIKERDSIDVEKCEVVVDLARISSAGMVGAKQERRSSQISAMGKRLWVGVGWQWMGKATLWLCVHNLANVQSVPITLYCTRVWVMRCHSLAQWCLS